MSKNNLHHIIKGNWNQIKGIIKNKWSKITDDDLENINGSYETLSGTLQKLYGYKMNDVENSLNELLDSNDLNQLKDMAESKFSEIKAAIFSTLDEYFKIAKRRSLATERAMTGYAKENPFKLIGMAAACGLLIGCLYKNNK